MVFKKNQIAWNKETKGICKSNKTSFKKENIPWNKGKKGAQIGWSKGKHIWENKKHPRGMLGKKHSKETIDKMIKQRKGHKVSKETREKLSLIHTGRKMTEEQIEKIKEARKKQVFPIKDTSIERKMQRFLKKLKIEFFTHQYPNIKHDYQCDILIPSKNLVIECDGNYWHNYPIGNKLDIIRKQELLDKGFKVLRLWEHEINEITITKFQVRLKNATL